MAQEERIESGEKRLTSSLVRPSLAILCVQHKIGIYQHDAELALRNTYILILQSEHIIWIYHLSPLCVSNQLTYTISDVCTLDVLSPVFPVCCACFYEILPYCDLRNGGISLFLLYYFYNTSCCLCTLFSIPSIPFRTTMSYRNFSLSCSIRFLLWYLSLTAIDSKRIWDYLEPLESLGCF